MKQLKSEKIKSEIIIECLDYIETKDKAHKEKALELLKEFAKYYNVFLNKQNKFDLKTSLRKFILNTEGYNNTLRQLYFALI